LELELKSIHEESRKTYGPERIQKELDASGNHASIGLIKRLRKKNGIRCKQTKKFKATTDSRHDLPVAKNLLKQRFEADSPNQVWVADITYIPTEEGWLYLAGIKDICTCQIVGYAMDKRMTEELVATALKEAVTAHRPSKGLIHHSDRGSQYCAREYRRFQQKSGIVTSMSRKGNCFDNAPMESFWGTLKNELVHHRRFETREQATREISEYIEIFYNRQRRHSRLGFLSPANFALQFVQEFQEKVAA